MHAGILEVCGTPGASGRTADAASAAVDGATIGAMDGFHTDMTRDIAAVAARLVAEEGLEYAAAKRQAVRQLGLPARTPLPDSDVVEAAVREHLALFCADTQPSELAALRQVALEWMDRLAMFRPYLGGAVWHGTATRHSDIYLQLYADDPKSVEWALLDARVEYHPGTAADAQGEAVSALTLRLPCRPLAQWVLVHLLVREHDDVRGALRPDRQGRRPRGSADDVRQLLSAASPRQEAV